MSVIESTLRLRVDDGGFASKLKSDAEAAKNLGASAKDLARLKVGPGGAALTKQLDTLRVTAGKVDAFRAASRGLDTLGQGLRSSGIEAERASKALLAAQRRVAFFEKSRASGSSNYPAFEGAGLVSEARERLKAATRAHTAATRRNARLRTDFEAQRTTVRALGSELERGGHSLANLDRTQGALRTRIDATTAALKRQAEAHEESRTAAVSSATEAGRRATAQLRATVLGAEGTRAERRAVAREAAAQARRANRTAMRRAIEEGRQSREAREEAVAAEASRRATAGRDMARGMGGAGRRQSADLEGGRRLTAGMSDPARRARAAAEADAAEREEIRAAHSASRRDAAGILAGAAGVRAASTGKRIAADAITSVAEFDIASRKQQVFTDIGVGDQAMLRAQAKRIGQETQFSNIDVVKAQTASMQGLPASFLPTLKAQVAEGIVENVRDYATLMETDLKEGAETIRSYLQAAGKDISTRQKALSEANLATNQLVRMAKLGGMDGSDVAQFVKFAAAPGTSSGLSTDTMLSLGALARRGGLRGDEAGVFMRATAAKLVSPTTKGVAALNAAGVNYSDYVKMPDRLSTDLLENQFKTSTGKSFTPKVREKVEAVNSDKALVADRAKYTAAITAAVSDILGKQKDGTVRASDARVASKAAGDFHKVSAKSVNAEGLLDAVMSREMTLAQLNAFLTDKHGGKGAITARQWEEFRASRQQIKAAGDDPNMARGKSREVMSGVGGSVENLRGSVDNAKLALGEAWAGPIQSLADGMGTAVDSFSKMPIAAQQATSAFGGVAAAGAGLWGTFALAGALLGKAGAGAGAGGAGLVAGTAGATAASVGAAGIGTLGIGAVAAYLASEQMKKTIDERGGGSFDAATGFTPDANPMAGMAPDKPFVSEWLKKQLPSVFGQREGSLPPGTAGMPQPPAPPRMPGLDGRPKPAVARFGDEAMLAGRSAGEAAPAPILRMPGFGEQKPPAAPQQPQEGAIDRIRRRGGEARKDLAAPASPAQAAPPAPAAAPAPTAPSAAPAPAVATALAPAAPIAPAPAVPAQAPASAPQVASGASPVPDPAKTEAATAALGAYRAELSNIKSELAATSSLDLPGVTSGLEARKAQLEVLIEGVTAKLREIGAQPVSPQVNTQQIDAVGPRADAAKASLEGLNVTARPMVDLASINAADAALDSLLSKMARIGASAVSTANAVRSIPSPAGAIRGRSSASFSDGVTPGAGAQ